MRLKRVLHFMKTSPLHINLGILTLMSVCTCPPRGFHELNHHTQAFSPHPLPVLLLLSSPAKDPHFLQVAEFMSPLTLMPE